MNLIASEELTQIADVASRFGRDYLSRGDGDTWARMAELGWTAMGVPESCDGLAMGPQERLVLAETFGRALITEPYWSTAVFGCDLLREAADDPVAADLLRGVATGDIRLAVLGADGFDASAPAGLRLIARQTGDGYRLQGRCPATLDADAADHWLVIARAEKASARPTEPDRPWALFLVAPDAAGVTARAWDSVDGRRCSDIRLDAVLPAARLSSSDAGPAIASAAALATLWLCGEAIGAMDALLTRTIGYLKERVQFGKPLASFQVLRHRVVDMYVTLEQGRSLVWSGLQAIDAEADPRDAAISAAKWHIGQGGRWLAESAVQLHGGIGMTEELPVGSYLRRLLAVDALLGNAGQHLSRYARLDARGLPLATNDGIAK